MPITVMSVEDTRATIEAKRTREGKHVKFFAELVEYLAENANGATVPVDMLAQEYDGEPLGTSAASLTASYAAKVKAGKDSRDATLADICSKLRVLKRKPASGEGLTVDDDGFCCLVVYN